MCGLIGVDVNTAALEEYYPVTDTWSRKADMPTKRNSMGVAVVNGKIYVIGGVNANTCDLSTVEEYDTATDKWTVRASAGSDVRKQFAPTQCLLVASHIEKFLHHLQCDFPGGVLVRKFSN